jgi:diguanylate cyclase (GGDEF)-like protein
MYKQLEVKVTVSIGFACFSNEFKAHERWIAAADKAMYQSKKNGRNKVTAYTDIKNDA